jgi:hypothetical protein
MIYTAKTIIKVEKEDSIWGRVKPSPFLCIVIDMRLEDKQALWTKYYLVRERGGDNFYTLFTFAINEAKEDKNVDRRKLRKIVRYMLKFLPKHEIAKKYTNFHMKSGASTMSKNELINNILQRI